MTAVSFVFSIVTAFLITAYFLHNYANWRKQQVVVIAATFIAWLFSFSMILVLPIDISSVSKILKLRVSQLTERSVGCADILPAMFERSQYYKPTGYGSGCGYGRRWGYGRRVQRAIQLRTKYCIADILERYLLDQSGIDMVDLSGDAELLGVRRVQRAKATAQHHLSAHSAERYLHSALLHHSYLRANAHRSTSEQCPAQGYCDFSRQHLGYVCCFAFLII